MGNESILTAELLDESQHVTLVEVCRFCLVKEERVIAMVGEGILAPSGRSPADWRFPAPSLLRAKRAVKLAQDFEIDMPAVALVLDLLDQIEMLRRRLG